MEISLRGYKFVKVEVYIYIERERERERGFDTPISKVNDGILGCMIL